FGPAATKYATTRLRLDPPVPLREKSLLCIGSSMRKTLFVLVVLILAYAGDSGASTLRSAPESESTERAVEPLLRDILFSEEQFGWQPKSTGKAVLYSLLLPGLGQRYLGETREARIFFTTEAVVWAGFITFQIQGNLREDEYKEYAQVFAGVSSTSHSDDYYKLLTQYDSSGRYEDVIKGDGRLILYPDVDVETLEQYFVSNRISDYEPWVWRSAEYRRAYQDRRSASKRAYRRSVYTVAAGIANRVASAFFAYRSGRRASLHGRPHQSRLHVEFGTLQHRLSDELQTRVSLVHRF
ncbi:MAG: DUF5683 domain-containing protein, partial [Candidatus Krumholzibacteria bacterium]|nr:DUF5683 domain-containing protein [Candidatus Krumholzibacteria bacterium]